MECRQFELMLSALIDGELSQPDRCEVENHLQACSECRHQLAILQQVDGELCEQLRGIDQQAQRLTDAVLAELKTLQPPTSGTRRASVLSGVARYGLAALAGFLLAVILTDAGWSLLPRQQDQAASDADRPESGEASGRPQPPRNDSTPVAINHALVSERSEAIARVTHATGDLSYKTPTDSDWRVVDSRHLPSLVCPSNTQLRTLSGGLAELETADGCRIRINENTEIALRATDNVELRTGDLWCRTPADRRLEVVTPTSLQTVADDGPPTVPAPEQESNRATSGLTVACQADSTCLTSRPSTDGLRVLAAAGTVSVRTGSQSQDVTTGSGVEYIGGELRPQQTYASVVDAERWVQPLMMLGGHQSPELNRRVEALLAHMGRAKLSQLYERDLRSLGEFSSLPLLSFLRSEATPGDAPLRAKAARILADTAPVWMIPDLLKLLQDSSPELRIPLASGLERLTGIPHELTRHQWDHDPDARLVAMKRWQDWWSINHFSCQLPPHHVPRGVPFNRSGYGELPSPTGSPQQQSPADLDVPPLIQKARVNETRETPGHP